MTWICHYQEPDTVTDIISKQTAIQLRLLLLKHLPFAYYKAEIVTCRPRVSKWLRFPEHVNSTFEEIAIAKFSCSKCLNEKPGRRAGKINMFPWTDEMCQFRTSVRADVVTVQYKTHLAFLGDSPSDVTLPWLDLGSGAMSDTWPLSSTLPGDWL